MAQFQITIIRPEGYVHSECFREVAETLATGLGECGHTARIAENTFDPHSVNIVLGSHLVTPEQAHVIPPGSIIYNLEQLGGAALPAMAYELAARFQVWDYSPLNMEKWRKERCAYTPVLVEVGYAPPLCRIQPAAEQDIDVLFYGSLNERRQRVLDKLKAAGAKIHSAFGVYGEERDRLIARAKIVLNVHYYDTQLFEIVRVSYLLANGKAVVTELSPDLGELAPAVASFPYDDLAGGCLQLLRDEPARRTLESKAFDLFSARDEARILSRALEESFREAAAAPVRKLNLGSGKDWREDCLNVDFNSYWEPDVVLDFSKPLPFGRRIETERLGAFELEEGSFDEIIANDVLEHIPNLATAMTSCLRLLKLGGVFKIQVPYDLSWGAWQDPTHRRAFNERSWLYYTDWFWYLEWTEARFDLDHIEFVLSEAGQQLRNQYQGAELVRQPRAVDAMRVTLRKRLLTAEEKKTVLAYLKRPERPRRRTRRGDADGIPVTVPASAGLAPAERAVAPTS